MVPQERAVKIIIAFQYTQNKKRFIIASKMIRIIDIKYLYLVTEEMEIINQPSAVDRVQS